MLKVIDVDFIQEHTLSLTFSDGFEGKADLSQLFTQSPFSDIEDFKRFSLTISGSLSWDGNELSAIKLRQLTIGEYRSSSPAVDTMEQIIKQAAWDSMLEDRPDILQAAIRSYVEHYGHQAVIETAGIKSRTSAYRSLKPQTTPNFGTLVHLCHAVIALAKKAEGEMASVNESQCHSMLGGNDMQR